MPSLDSRTVRDLSWLYASCHCWALRWAVTPSLRSYVLWSRFSLGTTLNFTSDHSPCPCCWGTCPSMMLPPPSFTIEVVLAGDEQHQVFSRHSAQSFLNLLYVWCGRLIDRVSQDGRPSARYYRERCCFQTCLRPLCPWKHSQLQFIFVFLNYVQSICCMWTPN